MDQSQVQTLALSLPEVTEEPHFHRRSFRVRGKIFATAIPSDPYLNVLVGESVREATLLMHPECVEKLFWGKKVLGLRVNLGLATQPMVAELLKQAWKEKAPRSLQAALNKTPDVLQQ